MIATIGQALNVALTDTDVANRRAHVTLSATGLPRGLSFRPNAPLVYGWPTATGSYRVTIHAKDSLGGISLMTFPLVVRPGIGAGRPDSPGARRQVPERPGQQDP